MKAVENFTIHKMEKIKVGLWEAEQYSGQYMGFIMGQI